jgi:hypothetical protein
MRGKRLSIGLRAALAIFTLTLLVTSTWAAAGKRCCIASAPLVLTAPAMTDGMTGMFPRAA